MRKASAGRTSRTGTPTTGTVGPCAGDGRPFAVYTAALPAGMGHRERGLGLHGCRPGGVRVAPEHMLTAGHKRQSAAGILLLATCAATVSGKIDRATAALTGGGKADVRIRGRRRHALRIGSPMHQHRVLEQDQEPHGAHQRHAVIRRAHPATGARRRDRGFTRYTALLRSRRIASQNLPEPNLPEPV